MTIFIKNQRYSFDDLVGICKKNGLTTVDCLKDENMVSVEEWDEKEECLGGECLFEFHRISEDVFKLTWQEDAEFMPKQFKLKIKKGCCSRCGSPEFISEPNRYDVLTFSKGNLEITGTEFLDDFKVFCRECSAEVIIE